MKDYFDYITNSYLAAIIYIVLGIYFIKKTLNDKKKELSYIGVGVFANTIAASIGAIVLGLILIYCKFKGKI